MSLLVLSGAAFAQTDSTALGLPALPVAPYGIASPQMIALGQQLFFDKRLSGDGKISCATCHQLEHAFSDGLPKASGIGDRIGTRKTPSLLGAAYNTSQFWDGRRTTLEEQALDPLLNPNEHGLKDSEDLLGRLNQDSAYQIAFKQAFVTQNQSIGLDQVRQALASYERTLVAANSPFDRYFYGADKSALSLSAARGLALFRGTARCVSCHTINDDGALFTDNQFHSLSVGLGRIDQRLPELTSKLVTLKARGGDIDQAILGDRDIAELGRFAVTLQPKDIGQFRTPSLRNVALTGPYMHDGSVPTLEAAVELEIYYRSHELGRPLILTPIEKADLVAFLKSLTSPQATTFTGPLSAGSSATSRTSKE